MSSFPTLAERITLMIWLLFVATATPAAAEFQLVDDSMELPFSAECNDALRGKLAACDYIERTEGRSDNWTLDLLDMMCTPQCEDSINTYRKAVASVCANDEFDTSNNGTNPGDSAVIMLPIAIPDYIFTNHFKRCLKTEQGEYCISQQSAEGPVEDCDECYLKSFREDLKNGLIYNDGMAEEFSSLTKSCGVSTLDYATPSPAIISSHEPPAATPTCDGRIATIKPGDTCNSFAKDNNVGTWRLLIQNGLAGGCAGFPTSGSLCVIGNCTTHEVTSSDTCRGLAWKYGITITQFITWNSILNPTCSNLNVMVGYQACVSYPGNATDTTNPYATTGVAGTATAPAAVPTKLGPDVNTRCGKYYVIKTGDYCQAIAMANSIEVNDFYFLNPDIDRNCTNLWLDYSYCVLPVGNIMTYSGYATPTGSLSIPTWRPTITGTYTPWESLPEVTWTSKEPIPTSTSFPLAKGTRKDCLEYEDNTFGDVPCNWLATKVDNVRFAEWNPSVNYWHCLLTNGTRYCTLYAEEFTRPGYSDENYEDDETAPYEEAPADAAVDSTRECYVWFVRMEGDTCASILETARITMEEFYAWNPSIKSDCSNLRTDTFYCMSGDYYDDDDDDEEEDDFSSTSASSTTSVSTTTTTTITSSDSTTTGPITTTKSTTTAASATAPGPTQTGISPTCDKWLISESGVYCADMAAKSDITLEELYAWNPALGDDCSGMWPDYAYCIGVSR
ncbi:hypothetical protein BDW59DRAFT_167529 [Aspergillus cavernicola]|uniref:LysM domain-containing protein n=1 Tax=Aspergillus cavernicola TaxID=176166 RepID=A0ABR4HCY4_9EURO